MKLGKHALRYFSRTGANTSGLSTFTRESLSKIEALERTRSMIKTSSYGTLASSLGNSFNLPRHRTKFKDIVIASYSTKSKGEDDEFTPEDNDRDSTESSKEPTFSYFDIRRGEEKLIALEDLELKGNQSAKPGWARPGDKDVYNLMSSNPKRLPPVIIGRIIQILQTPPPELRKKILEKQDRNKLPPDQMNEILELCASMDKLKKYEEIVKKDRLPNMFSGALNREAMLKFGSIEDVLESVTTLIEKGFEPRVSLTSPAGLNNNIDSLETEQTDKNKESQDEKAEEDSSTRPSNN